MTVMRREDRKRRNLLFKEALTTPWHRQKYKRIPYEEYLTANYDCRRRKKSNFVYASTGYVDTVFTKAYRFRYASVTAKMNFILFQNQNYAVV